MPQATEAREFEFRDLPIQTRAAPIQSVNTETRTAALCWSTGAAVKRYDWYNDRYYMEELSMDPAHIDLTRLQAGAPLLDSHDSYGLNQVLGVVESASVANGEGLAEVRFSSRADVEPVFQDVRAGIIRNVSVGYRVHEFDRIPPAEQGGTWIYRAIRWEPYEISLVAIPADPAAGVRSEPSANVSKYPCKFFSPSAAAESLSNPDGVRTMTTPVQTAAAESQSAVETTPTAQVRAGIDAPAAQPLDTGTRALEILEAVRLAKLPIDFAENLIRSSMSVDGARKAILSQLAANSEQSPVRTVADIVTTRDETETTRSLMAEAIVHRLDPSKPLTEGAGEYRYRSLVELGSECLERRGVRVRGLSRMEIAERSMHSTSDFPAILANVMNKRLRDAYLENGQTYQQWARRAPNAPDFKNIDIVQLSAMPDLLPLGEAGEVKYGRLSDGKESYAVTTVARALSVTRQTMINDDLRALDRVVQGFGASARRYENRTVYGQLAGNPLMADGKTLFHADHGNLDGAGAISLASLSASRKLMRKQKGLQGEELNLAPAFLLVPTDLEQVAYQFTSTQFVPAKSTDVNEFRAGGRTALTPIVEPILDAYSPTAWYLAAQNGQVDTVEFCYLDGSEGVYIESTMEFDIEGMKIKARLDFAAKAVDFRGLVKNPGQ